MEKVFHPPTIHPSIHPSWSYRGCWFSQANEFRGSICIHTHPLNPRSKQIPSLEELQIKTWRERIWSVHYRYCHSARLPSFLSSTAYSAIWKPLHWPMLYIPFSEHKFLLFKFKEMIPILSLQWFASQSLLSTCWFVYSNICSKCWSHQPSFCGSNNGYCFLVLVTIASL